jgi:hypothetical protein
MHSASVPAGASGASACHAAIDALDGNQQEFAVSDGRLQQVPLVKLAVGGVTDKIEDKVNDVPAREDGAALIDAGRGEPVERILDRAHARK